MASWGYFPFSPLPRLFKNTFPLCALPPSVVKNSLKIADPSGVMGNFNHRGGEGTEREGIQKCSLGWVLADEELVEVGGEFLRSFLKPLAHAAGVLNQALFF